MRDRLQQLPDEELGAALRALSPSLDWPAAVPPSGGPDLATRVRARIVAAGPPGGGPARRRWPLRPALVFALVGLLLIAAVAGAVGLGVPGIRLFFGEAPPSTPATSGPSLPPAGPPGSNLGLGELVGRDDLDERAGFPVRFPADPALGPPVAAYVTARNEVSLVWGTSGTLPATADPRIGLLLTEFRGRLAPNSMSKIIQEGTTLEPVTVGDAPGFWISGEAHVFFYEGPDGERIVDGRRWVGDTLIWTEGELTYRLETALGREAAIRIAESLE